MDISKFSMVWTQFTLLRLLIFVILAITLVFLLPYAALITVGVTLALEITVYIFTSWKESKLDPMLNSQSPETVKQMQNIKVSDQISAEEAAELPATISKILGVSFVQNQEDTANVVNALKILNAQPVFRIILNSIAQKMDGGVKVEAIFSSLDGGSGGLNVFHKESGTYFIGIGCNKRTRGLQRGIVSIAELTIHEFTKLMCHVVFQNHSEAFRKGDFRVKKVLLEKALQADYEFCRKVDTPEHKNIVRAFNALHQAYGRGEEDIENRCVENMAHIITVLAMYGNKMRALMPNCWDYLLEHFLPAIATEQDQELVQNLQRDKEIDLDLQDPERHRRIPTVILVDHLERAIKSVETANKSNRC